MAFIPETHAALTSHMRVDLIDIIVITLTAVARDWSWPYISMGTMHKDEMAGTAAIDIRSAQPSNVDQKPQDDFRPQQQVTH